MARPAPSRPPETAIRYIDGIAQHDAIVKELQDRISMLEQALAEQRGTPVRITPPSSSSSFRSLSLPESRKSPVPEWPSFDDPITRETSLEVSPPSSLPPATVPTDLCYTEMDLASTIPHPLPTILYESSSTLAHLCLAQHGEFIGRGSLICALHSVSSSKPSSSPSGLNRQVYYRSRTALRHGSYTPNPPMPSSRVVAIPNDSPSSRTPRIPCNSWS